MATRMEQEFTDRCEGQLVRLNKYLSESGVCSRREADRLIQEGKILVDGQSAVPGMKIREGQEIVADGKPVCREREMILLAVNKPVGVVCTTDKRWGDRTVEEVLNYPKRVFYVGRLDKDSEGLLLMTNNGDILNKIMKAGNYHEKEYEVTVDKPVTPEFIKSLETGGIPVLDAFTRPCKAERTGRFSFRIILTQGLNRQIRRMCEYLGFRVLKLKRVRIMNICLGNLKPGEYRKLSDKEVEHLYDKLKFSRNDIMYER